jgi:hypothetical protein
VRKRGEDALEAYRWAEDRYEEENRRSRKGRMRNIRRMMTGRKKE